MDPKYIEYSRVVAVMAQQGVLSTDVAQRFCAEAVPQLVAEIEVLQRLTEHLWSEAIAAPPEPVTPPDTNKKPAKKARRKTKRAKK